jgi:PKD repeat protein
MYEKFNDGPWKVRIGISSKVTSVQYRLLEEGTYKFYLTAINSDKLESKPSTEVVLVSERPVPQPSATPR